jgi:signal transduction histidine kinase/CheY-like chemotaxis protein
MLEKFPRLKKKIHDNTPVILFAIFLSTSLLISLSTYLHNSHDLTDDSQIIADYFGNEIDAEITKRIELIDVLINQWISTENRTNFFSYDRYLQTIPYYFEFYEGYLALNWINASGVINWVYPYDPNVGAINRSVVYLMSGGLNIAFNTAQDVHTVGLTNVTGLFQGGMGIVSYHPIIFTNQTTLEEEILGYFNVVIQIDPFIEQIINKSTIINDYSFSLMEFEKEVYHYHENFTQTSAYVGYAPIEFYNRTWDLYFHPTDAMINARLFTPTLPYIIIGISASILSLVLSYSLLQKGKVIEQTYKEKQTIEEQLIQAQKMESLGTLAGGVAHDFNNILMGLQGNIFLLQEEEIDGPGADSSGVPGPRSPPTTLYSKFQEDFDDIQQMIDRAKDMTAEILSFSRQSDFNLQTLDLKKTIEGSLNIFKKTIDKRIEIDLEFLSGTTFIKGDKTRLHQIFTNILVNARDALPYGGKIRISVGIQPRTKTAGKTNNPAIDPDIEYVVHISDNGIGIKKEALAHIFDPFFTTKTLGKGTGLGLSIVYNAVKAMNGHIEVQSKEKQGTTFSIYFPKLNRVTSLSGKKPAFPTSIEIEELAGLKALIIEDEQSIGKSIAKYLSHLEIQSITHSSSEEALVYYNRHYKELDLVILDINMPKLSGVEIYRQMKRLKKIPKILFITGYSAERIPDLEAPNVEMLQKPFKFTELMEKISRLYSNPKDNSV